MAQTGNHTPGPWMKARRNGVQVVQGAATECVAVIPDPVIDGFGVTSRSEREASRGDRIYQERMEGMRP